MVASTQSEMDLMVQKIMKMIDRLEDLDDVQNVYSNADISADHGTAGSRSVGRGINRAIQ